MGVEQQIRDALVRGLAPSALQVINESTHHAGHAGDDGSGESHWRVVIRSDRLAGLSRLARHRAVHDAIGPEIIGRIHALAITIED